MSTSLFQIPKNTGFTYGAPKILATQATGATNSAFNRARAAFGTTVDTFSQTTSGKGQYIGYFVSILVILFAMLTFIHYFITPIWQLNPGGSGVIPVPGFSDSKVFWKNVRDEQPINDASQGFGTVSANWSMSIDTFISDPFSHDTKARIIFARCPDNVIHPSSSVLTKDSVDTYNLVMAMVPSTNDLVVSTLNTNDNSEDIIIPNVPVQKPFRIGVVLFDSMMEVYVNGMLYKTRQFSAPTKQVFGYFRPVPSNNIGGTIKIKNLIVWNRTVSPPEMRYAKPSLANADEFDPSSMPSESSCPASTAQAIGSTVQSSMNQVLRNRV